MDYKQAPPDENTEVPKKGKGGRPTKKPPMRSLLRVLKDTRTLTEENGKMDASLARYTLATLATIVLEDGLLADDKEVSIKTKVEWTLRIAPFIAMLETLIPKAEAGKYPKTEAALSQESHGRAERLAKLIEKGITPNVEAVLDTYAPAAAVPPEEA